VLTLIHYSTTESAGQIVGFKLQIQPEGEIAMLPGPSTSYHQIIEIHIADCELPGYESS
jgi:hypothetical protein